ncbi:type 1 glutamine amidotransferase domain-containing protein [Salinimicrobium sp. MT39]|jgi:putative intracellular protease/amidase|uniref:Type 1 glutamine amidotransferase domain-containing protein n=1 Tax=Salinimicrobium profundisediminis TaxID=2994553 RepID=A0A9X3CVM3_9FLAO|nr:type 1 glutamine amidotransferase domain-containing protein [Salinimicrobium profundisediminis]MCX2837363.1 type 1 glutamine amidotransferase domain-containing protein [Salinimicrobium profundisediminis]
MKILMVLTSHDKLGDTGKKTGFWVEEFAAPYYVLADAGAEITLASPKGGQPPIDPSSTTEDAQTEATKRFDKDDDLQKKLSLTKKLEDVDAKEFDAVFYPGGHGPLWDLANDLKSIALIEAFNEQMKPMAFVCHAPGVLANVEDHKNPLVRGKKVTGFANSEEDAVGLTNVVPFLVEDKMNQLGADYSKGDDWSSYVLVDGKLITGQNPASSEKAARELLNMLQK